MPNLPAHNRVRSVESAESVLVLGSGFADTDVPSPHSRAVVIGTSGTLHVTMLDGSDVTLPAMPDGFTWPIQVTKVWGDSGATNVTVLY